MTQQSISVGSSGPRPTKQMWRVVCVAFIAILGLCLPLAALAQTGDTPVTPKDSGPYVTPGGGGTITPPSQGPPATDSGTVNLASSQPVSSTDSGTVNLASSLPTTLGDSAGSTVTTVPVVAQSALPFTGSDAIGLGLLGLGLIVGGFLLTWRARRRRPVNQQS